MKYASIAFLALLTACSAGNSAVPAGAQAPTGPQAAARASGIRFHLTIPNATGVATGNTVVSPATKSLIGGFVPGPTEPIVLLQLRDLLPSSSGCVSKIGATTCDVTIDLGPGKWSATINTFDETGGHGRQLETARLATVSVERGKITTVSLKFSKTAE